MQLKTALLSLTAAMLLTTGLTGCTYGTNQGMTTKGVRTNTVGRTTAPGMNTYTNPNYNPNRNYNTYGTHPSGTDGVAPYGTRNANMYGAYPYTMGGPHQGYSAYGTHTYGTHPYGTGTTGNQQMHTGTKAEMSDKIAKKVSTIPGVKSANVMLYGNNAYVAVSTKDTGTTGMKSKSTTTGGKMTTHTTGSGQVPQDLKDKIGKEVKSMAPNCQNVYVSSDANFVSHMNDFAKQAAAGHPIQGFTTEFQDMVSRLFPTNAAPSTTHTAPSATSYMAPGTR
ncbi:YhcN/YlaJ family sporulation lipoprotein [Paenibacillus marinisediminis]